MHPHDVPVKKQFAAPGKKPEDGSDGGPPEEEEQAEEEEGGHRPGRLVPTEPNQRHDRPDRKQDGEDGEPGPVEQLSSEEPAQDPPCAERVVEERAYGELILDDPSVVHEDGHDHPRSDPYRTQEHE